MHTRIAALLAMTTALSGTAVRAADPGPPDALLATPGAAVVTPRIEPAPDAAAAGFESLDADRSGAIDRSEVRYLPRLATEFDRWDGDHSGSLNATEFRMYMEQTS